MGMFIRLVSVVIYAPSFFLPAFFVSGFGAWIGQVYMRAQLSVKREMSNAKSPVLDIFGGAIAGLGEWRAY